MYRLKFDSEKPYLFISYSSKNKEIVENNVEYLQKKYSLNVWYDEDLTAGTEWDREALPKLRDPNCKIVIFFASEEALMSKNVKKELDAAKRFHKGIIPINFSEMPFDNVLNSELVRKYNRTDPDGVTNADHLIQDHLNENKTYIFLHKINYYSELIKAIIRHSENTIEIIETDYNPETEKKSEDGAAVKVQLKEHTEAVVKTIVEKPAVEKPAVEKTAVAKAAVEKAAVEKADVEKTAIGRPVIEKPEAVKPKSDSIVEKAADTTSNIIRYSLNGKEYESNQSEFMYSVFEAIVPKHTDKLTRLDKELTSLSLTDYSVVERAARPTYFRGCYSFLAGGQKVCVGSSYNLGEKLKQIEKLLKICGEDNHILEILTDSDTGNKKIEENPVKEDERNSREKGDVNFLFLGKEYKGYVYSDLLAKVIEELFIKYPDKIGKALKTLDSFITDTKPEPFSCFRGVKTIHVNSKTYYVGTNTSTPTKMKQIINLLNVMGIDTGKKSIIINDKSLEEIRDLSK